MHFEPLHPHGRILVSDRSHKLYGARLNSFATIDQLHNPHTIFDRLRARQPQPQPQNGSKACTFLASTSDPAGQTQVEDILKQHRSHTAKDMAAALTMEGAGSVCLYTGTFGAQSAWHLSHPVLCRTAMVLQGTALISIQPDIHQDGMAHWINRRTTRITDSAHEQHHVQNCTQQGALCMHVPEGAAVRVPPRCAMHVLCKTTNTCVLESSACTDSCEEQPQDYLLWALETAARIPDQLPLPRATYRLYTALRLELLQLVGTFDQLTNRQQTALRWNCATYTQRVITALPWALNVFEDIDKPEVLQLAMQLLNTSLNMIKD